MDSYLKFALVALASILVGVPLWTVVMGPDEFSIRMFTESGFWVTATIGMAILLFGFWVSQRADLS